MAEKLLPAAHGLLEVALQDPRHDEHRLGVSQEIPAVEVEPAAPRLDATERSAAAMSLPMRSSPARAGQISSPASPRGLHSVVVAPAVGRRQRHPAVARPGGHGVADQDRRNPARYRAHRGNEVLERRAIGADEVNAERRAPARPGSRDRRARRCLWRRARNAAPVRAGGHRTPRESARRAAARAWGRASAPGWRRPPPGR